MAARALYRKYRPKSLDEIIGQPHIVDTLRRAIDNNRLSHAYLLSGPRGVGKTSVARILAYEINGIKYDEDNIHLDIIEIDAASNRRIDEIRELRERVHIAPTSARYKVYIIDEVHMLTREAFNALLKTLEEPPVHCIFILATTEAHKLPETIISRTQRFTFKPVSKDEVTGHLKTIAKKEKIDITQEALGLLAEHGEGSFRDSISLLDQLSSSSDKVDAEQVRLALGIPQSTALEELIAGIQAGNSSEVLRVLDDLRQQGVHPAAVAKKLSEYLRVQLIEGNTGQWVAELLRQLLDAASSSQPQDTLEINLLEASSKLSKSDAIVKKPTKPELPELAEAPEHSSRATSKPQEVKASKVASNIADFSLGSWPSVVEAVKVQAYPLYSVLRLANPTIEGDTLTLAFKFSLHQKKLSQIKNRQDLSRIIEEKTGRSVNIVCIVDKTVENDKTVASSAADESLPNDDKSNLTNAISDIFGGAEVLKS